LLLIIGAELLVRAAARLAAGLGVRPLLVGPTVVTFGSSAPQLAVTSSKVNSDGIARPLEASWPFVVPASSAPAVDRRLTQILCMT